jgi:hypothetical protein
MPHVSITGYLANNFQMFALSDGQSKLKLGITDKKLGREMSFTSLDGGRQDFKTPRLKSKT